MKKAIGILAVIAAAAVANAGLINSSFETGDLTGWTSLGYVSATTDNPFVGAYDAFLNPDNSIYTQHDVETFLGIPLDSLGTFGDGSPLYYNGSALQQTFFASAGEKIAFSFNFTSGDQSPFDDAAFVVLNGQTTMLANVASVGGNFGNTTGWHTFEYVASYTGSQTLSFAVLNWGNEANFGQFNPSFLQIDTVPGPAAGLVFALACVRRRRRKL